MSQYQKFVSVSVDATSSKRSSLLQCCRCRQPGKVPVPRCPTHFLGWFMPVDEDEAKSEQFFADYKRKVDENNERVFGVSGRNADQGPVSGTTYSL